MYDVYIQRACAPNLLPGAISKQRTCLPTRFPFLVSGVTGNPLPEVLAYLRHVCLSKVKPGALKLSPHTVDAKVSDLRDLHDYLDAIAIESAQVGVAHLQAYVDGMRLEGSPVTGREYADTTIRRRMDTVRGYFEFLQARGLVKARFDVGQIRPERRSRYNPDKLAPEVWEPDGRSEDMEVVAIEPDLLPKILSHIGPLRAFDPATSFQESTAASRRDRLMCETACQTGIRRSEVVNLRIERLPKITPTMGAFELRPVRLFRKGGRWRNVLFPVWLLREIDQYIQSDRSRAVQRRLEGDPSFKDHGLVFVRGSETRTKAADQLNPKHLDRIFANAQKELGIVRGVACTNDKGVREVRKLARYGFHSLRHTYAVMTYYVRRSQGDSEPWKFIQCQLDHKDVSTTERIYLRVVHELESAASQMLELAMRERINCA